MFLHSRNSKRRGRKFLSCVSLKFKKRHSKPSQNIFNFALAGTFFGFLCARQNPIFQLFVGEDKFNFALTVALSELS